MRRRIGPALVSLLCGVAVLLPATGAEADPGGPVISSHTDRVVRGHRMSPAGAYPLALHVTTDRPACALHVVQYLGEGGTSPVDRGEVPMTGTEVDVRWTVPADYSLMQELAFVLRARDCSGVWGPEHRVYGFDSRVDDDTYRRIVRPRAGVWRTISDPDCYGGSNLRSVSGVGATISFISFWGGFGAVYGLTGPRGGVATAYISGERVGTVSFYSPTPRRGRLILGFERPIREEGYQVTLVMTSPGAGGGTRMYVDAFVNPIFD